MLRLRTYLITAALGLFVIQGAWAQDQPTQNPPAQQPVQPQNPMPPATEPDTQSSGNQQPVPPVIAGTINNAPITGANGVPLGVFSSNSFISPAFEFFQQFDSNGTNTPFGKFAATTSLLGMVDVQKIARFSEFNLGYLIGRSFSTTYNAFNSTTNAFNTSYLWTRGRWDGFVSDRLFYSSQSSYLGGITPFQVAGLGNFAGAGAIGPIILRSPFLPEQGIFTNFGPRLSNALVGQVNNHLSRRTYVTMVANYDTLRFTNSGLIDSSSAGFQAGIGYQRTHEDSIALIYRFNDLWFSGVAAGVRDNVFEAAYQRQIAERWSFQIGAGPDISFIHAPDTVTGARSDVKRISWTGDVSLRREFRRMGMNFGYRHYLTNGGGVFLGSELDSVYGSVGRDFSRDWRVTASVSYAHNKNLISFPTLSPTAAPPGSTFTSVYGGIQAHRRLGRDSDLFVGYIVRHQTSSYFFCTTPTGINGVCLGPDTTGNLLNFGFIWRIKPIPIG